MFGPMVHQVIEQPVADLLRCCNRGIDQPVRVVSECRDSCVGEVIFEKVF